jgi:ElaB/YqjD/DUF883 family membrane-anchored ribosome-binding protein
MSRMSETGTVSGSQAERAAGTGEQLRQTGSQIQQNLRDMGGQVRDAASEKFNQLREQASEYYEQGRQRAREWEQGLEEYVHEKPLQSLLIAAGIGALIGFLWRRS